MRFDLSTPLYDVLGRPMIVPDENNQPQNLTLGMVIERSLMVPAGDNPTVAEVVKRGTLTSRVMQIQHHEGPKLMDFTADQLSYLTNAIATAAVGQNQRLWAPVLIVEVLRILDPASVPDLPKQATPRSIVGAG